MKLKRHYTGAFVLCAIRLVKLSHWVNFINVLLSQKLPVDLPQSYWHTACSFVLKMSDLQILFVTIMAFVLIYYRLTFSDPQKPRRANNDLKKCNWKPTKSFFSLFLHRGLTLSLPFICWNWQDFWGWQDFCKKWTGSHRDDGLLQNRQRHTVKPRLTTFSE